MSTTDIEQDLALHLRERTARFYFAEDPHLEMAKWLLADIIPNADQLIEGSMDAITEREALRAQIDYLERMKGWADEATQKELQYLRDVVGRLREVLDAQD